MTIEEIQARHNEFNDPENIFEPEPGFDERMANNDRGWLLSEIKWLKQETEKLEDYLLKKQDRIDELTQELIAEKAVSEFSRETVRIAANSIDSLKLELAEERAASNIAGHAMDAMRAKIDKLESDLAATDRITDIQIGSQDVTIARKDEKIRLLMDVVSVCDMFGVNELAQDKFIKSREALEAFDKEKNESC